MIVYHDILAHLKAAGYNQTRIRAENIFPQSVLQRLRTGDPITMDTLDRLCGLTGCQPGELITWKPDEKARE